MELKEIHQVFLRAAIECAQNGATARQLLEYMEKSIKGMTYNAAFRLFGPDFVELLQSELES